MKYRNLLLVALLLMLVATPLLAQDEMAEPDLRIGALPVVNMLPLYVALDGGYFDEVGITVEIVDYPSGKDAQAAAIAGEIDGFQADLVSALKVNAAGVGVHVVRHVGITNTTFVHIVTGRGSGIESAEDLAGKRVGLSLNTIIQYMTDTLLASAGMSSEDVEYVDVPGIYNRVQRLVDGDIDAATLPGPYNQFALTYGGVVIIDDANVDYVPEALIIRAEVLAEKGEAVRAFLQAYERGVATLDAMNGDPEAFREFRNQAEIYSNFWPPVELFFHLAVSVPTFSTASVPTETDYASVKDWALAVGLLEEELAYESMVASQFLPEARSEVSVPLRKRSWFVRECYAEI